jgi:hypothetical protein
MSNNLLSVLLLLATLFIAACLTVYDYRKTRSGLGSTLRSLVYFLVALLLGTSLPFFSGGLGGFESGRSEASVSGVIGAFIVALLEVGCGAWLLRRSGRSS